MNTPIIKAVARMSWRDSADKKKHEDVKTHAPKTGDAAKDAQEHAAQAQREAEDRARTELAQKEAAEKVRMERDEALKKADKARREMAAQQQADESDTVLVMVPKRFHLTLDNMHRLTVEAGTQRLPRGVAEHWYAKANGVKPVSGEGSSESLTAAIYDDAAKKVASGDSAYSRDYVVGSLSSFYHVDRATVEAEIDKRVTALLKAKQA